MDMLKVKLYNIQQWNEPKNYKHISILVIATLKMAK
jgi:hypothetical protein